MSRSFIRSTFREFLRSPNRERDAIVGRPPTDSYFYFALVGDKDTAIMSQAQDYFDPVDYMFPNQISGPGAFTLAKTSEALPTDILSQQLNQPVTAGEIIRMRIRIAAICELYDPEQAVEVVDASGSNSFGDDIQWKIYNRENVFWFSWSGFTFLQQPDTFTPENFYSLNGSIRTGGWDSESATRLILNRGVGGGLYKIDKTISFTMKATASSGGMTNGISVGRVILRHDKSGTTNGTPFTTGPNMSFARRNKNLYDADNEIHPPAVNLMLPSPQQPILTNPPITFSIREEQVLWAEIQFIQRNTGLTEHEPTAYGDVHPPIAV